MAHLSLMLIISSFLWIEGVLYVDRALPWHLTVSPCSVVVARSKSSGMVSFESFSVYFGNLSLRRLGNIE